MALSGREVLLVLRARDEATRTLHRVSRTMSAMDKQAAAASSEVINRQNAALHQMQREMGNVQAAYSRTAAEAKALHDMKMNEVQNGMVLLRRRTDEVQRAYQNTTLAAQKLRQQGKIEASEYQKRMHDARALRATQLQDIQRERYALEDASRAANRQYQAQMNNARQLRIEQKETIRAMKTAAQDEIAQHKERLAAIHAEQEAIRARGQALVNNGSAAITAGATMVAAAYAGARGITAGVKAAVEWDKQLRTTFTQVDVAGAKLRDIEDIGLEVAKSIPVAFEEIQPALYDIFSSIDVNLNEARTLVKQFSKDAIGGQADVATATRANIAIMNAYNVSVKDATEVSDFMFKLVQKGVGTYEEFANVIGRSIPSARRAGQTYHTLGAMLVFMTRNGMSAAMASTSAARALDALSHPGTVSRLKKLGIEVRDATGEFRPLPAILNDMHKEFGKLTAPQRAKALQELFKGSGGTIQARRFFDMYFKNAKDFNKHTREMIDTTGEAQKAFEKMEKSPAAKLQALKNQWQIMIIQLGQNLIPILSEVARVISKVLNWFNNLPAPVKRAVAVIALLVTGMTAVIGTITIFAGAAMVFVGACRMMGIGALGAAGKLAGLTLGLGALATGFYMVREGSTNTQKNLGVLATAVGGAAIGSAFGPLGAAIGGVAGALAGVALKSKGAEKGVKTASEAAREALGSWKEYKKTLDDVSGATTRATRDLVREKLEKAKLLDVTRKLNIADSDVISGIASGGAARDQLIKRLNRQRAAAEKNVNAAIKEYGIGNQLGDAMVGQAMERVRLIDTVLDEVGAVDKAISAKKREILLTKAQGKAYKSLPSEVKVKFEQPGFDRSFKGIKELTREYKLTPKQVRTLVKAGNVDLTKGQLKALINLAKDLDRQKPHVDTSASTKPAKDNILGLLAWINRQSATITVNQKMGRRLTGAAAAAGAGAGAAGGGREAERFVDGVGRALSSNKVKRGLGKKGKYILHALMGGIPGEIPKLSTMFDAIDKVLKRDFTAKMRKQILKATRQDFRRLQNMARRIKNVHAQLEKAQERLRKLREERAQYVSQVREQIKGFGSFSQIGGFTDVFGNEEPPTARNIAMHFRDRLKKIKRFGANLKKILKMGYGKAIFNQIVQMGPEAGADYAQALVDATPKQVREIRTLQSQIGSQANSIATHAGNQMYNAGIQAAQGLVNGLKKKQKALIKIANQLATNIVKTIKRRLKIKSPSGIGIDIGMNFGDSISRGISQQVPLVEAASRKLAAAAYVEIPAPTTAANYLGRPVVGSGYVGPAASTTKVEQTFNISTQEIDPKRHAGELGILLAGRYR